MKNVRAEKVTLKRKLHGFLKAQRSFLPTRLKNLLGGKKQLLASYLHIRNCWLTL